jgi:Fic family protein
MNQEDSGLDIELMSRFVIESDAIENLKADPVMVKKELQFDYNEGHVGALLLLDKMAKNRQPLTHEAIQEVQGLITAEQTTKGGEMLPSEYISRYRPVGVRVGGRICPPPHMVWSLMARWLMSATEWLKTTKDLTDISKLEKISDLHFDYEFIHPFADGNGRSGRVIVYYLMIYTGLKPFVFSSKDRFHTYYPAFQSHKQMQKYFKSKMKEVAK